MRFLLLFIFCLTIHHIHAQNFEENLRLAYQKYNEKDYAYAEVLIDKVLAEDSLILHAYILKSNILLRRGSYYDALNVLHTVYNYKPESMSVLESLGIFHQITNSEDSCMFYYKKMYDKVIEEEDDTGRAYVLIKLGTVKNSFLNHHEAITDFEEALKILPNEMSLLNNLSIAYSDTRQYEKAVACLREILKQEPNNNFAFSNLGLYFTEMDLLDSALVYYSKGLELDDENGYIYSNRGHLYYKQERYYKALEDLDKAVYLYPSNSYAFRNRALVFIALEDFEAACKDLEHAILLDYHLNYGTEVEELTKKYCNKKRKK